MPVPPGIFLSVITTSKSSFDKSTMASAALEASTQTVESLRRFAVMILLIFGSSSVISTLPIPCYLSRVAHNRFSQSHGESHTSVPITAQPQIAAMRSSGTSGDSEAKTGSRWFGGKKRFEDSREIGVGYGWTGISNVNGEHFLVQRCVQSDLSPFLRRVHCIQHQIQ